MTVGDAWKLRTEGCVDLGRREKEDEVVSAFESEGEMMRGTEMVGQC